MEVFPYKMGVMIGLEEDSAARALGVFYRLPETFYHLSIYIAHGKIFFNPIEGTWDATEPDRVGRFERGHEREKFLDWVRRQVARLEIF